MVSNYRVVTKDKRLGSTVGPLLSRKRFETVDIISRLLSFSPFVRTFVRPFTSRVLRFVDYDVSKPILQGTQGLPGYLYKVLDPSLTCTMF